MIKIILYLALAGLAHGVDLRKIYNTPGVTRAEDLIHPGQEVCGLDELAKALQLGPDTGLSIESTSQLPNGYQRAKLRIDYKHLPVRVFTLQATLDAHDKFTGAVSGYIPKISDINTTANIPPKELRKILADYLNQVNTRSDVENASPKDIDNFAYTKDIDIDLDSGKPVLVYYVSGTITGVSNRYPRVTVDAETGNILQGSFLVTTLLDSSSPRSCPTSVGGNEKCPGPLYGPGIGEICINATLSDGYTLLANDKVKVYNMKGGSDKKLAKIVKFKPEKGPEDAINGASSPAIDTFFYLSKFVDFMREWGNLTLNKPIKAYVHAGKGFANSFFDGHDVMFGDGNFKDPSSQGKIVFHPLTVADAIAHEAAHIYSNKLNNFNYRDESDAVSEAFSDISAAAFSAYMDKKGRVDRWDFGYCFVKRPNEALRYFDDPSRDNVTYTNVQNYTSKGFPYNGLGIFTKTFYCAVTDKNIPIRLAFQTFAYANSAYWTESTGILDGACGVYRAASDLGLKTNAFSSCFKGVGIDLKSFCGLEGTGGGVTSA